MCLNINSKYHPHRKALVAQEDILVYKALFWCNKHFFKSPYRGTHWHINKSVSMKSKFSFSGDSVGRGIHAYINLSNADRYLYDPRLHYAIIPKGTMFYIGKCYDVVSHKLVVFETIKDYSDYKASKNYKTITLSSYVKKYLAG